MDSIEEIGSSDLSFSTANESFDSITETPKTIPDELKSAIKHTDNHSSRQKSLKVSISPKISFNSSITKPDFTKNETDDNDVIYTKPESPSNLGIKFDDDLSIASKRSKEISEQEENDYSEDENKRYRNIDKYKIWSIVYGLTILVLGILLPIVETATSGTLVETQIADSLFEIIIFSISLLWFLYIIIDVHIYLWRRRIRMQKGQEDFACYTHDSSIEDGGLYLRIGCGFFCMATLLFNGLALAEAFEFEGFCESRQIIARNSLRFLFSFLQYAFLFKNSNVIIRTNHLVAYLGLTHLIVTNMCVWFKFILEETFDSVNEEIRDFHGNFNETIKNHSSTKECLQLTTQVTDIAKRINIFLIPCAIEFSIMSVTLYYVIWKNIDKREFKKKAKEMRRYSIAIAETQMFHIDCNNSLKGIFGGILTLLLTMIIVIIYLISGAGHTKHTILTNWVQFDVIGIILSEALEIILLLLCNLATLSIFYSMKTFSYLPYKSGRLFAISFEELAEIFTLFGVVSFSLFRVLAFRYSDQKGLYLYLLFANGILSFFQAILQTMLILEANRKRSTYGSRKGRETISFLIILNLSIWLLYSVSRNKYANVLFVNPQINVASESFNEQASQNAQAIKWIMINTVSYPLMLYFHFHSSCCLSFIWRNCYAKNLATS